MGYGLLEGDLVVLGGEAGDPGFDLLGLGVVLEQLIAAEAGGNGLHAHVDAGIFLFGLLLLPPAEGGGGGWGRVSVNVLMHREGGVVGEGPHLLQLGQELDVRLRYLLVLLVVTMRKRLALVVAVVLLLGNSSGIEGELVLPVLTDFLELAEVGLVEPGWQEGYIFCWNSSVTAGALVLPLIVL